MKHLTSEELIKRIQLIEKKVMGILISLDEQGVPTDVKDVHNNSIDSYYSEIMTLCDINDDSDLENERKLIKLLLGH